MTKGNAAPTILSKRFYNQLEKFKIVSPMSTMEFEHPKQVSFYQNIDIELYSSPENRLISYLKILEFKFNWGISFPRDTIIKQKQFYKELLVTLELEE